MPKGFGAKKQWVTGNPKQNSKQRVKYKRIRKQKTNNMAILQRTFDYSKPNDGLRQLQSELRALQEAGNDPQGVQDLAWFTLKVSTFILAIAMIRLTVLSCLGVLVFNYVIVPLFGIHMVAYLLPTMVALFVVELGAELFYKAFIKKEV